MSVFSIIVQDDREQAIEAAAQHIYEEKGDRAGVSYIGWHAEPDDVREEWLTDVRSTIDAYEAARRGGLLGERT